MHTHNFLPEQVYEISPVTDFARNILICMYSSFFSSRKYFLLHLWFGAQFLHQRPATYRILFIACPYLLSSLWSFLSFISTSILRVWRKPWKKSYDQPRQHIKKQRHYLADKGPSSQSYGFPRSHVWMWKLDHKESWALKNWCFWTVMLEKTLESPLDCKEIQPVHPKGNQSWVFIGRIDAKAEAPILWPPDAKSLLIWKDPDAGKDWGQEEKGTTENEMVGWYYQLNGHEFEQAPGVGDGQERLACCSPWGHKESDTTEWLNWTEHSKRTTQVCTPLHWFHFPHQFCSLLTY